MADFIRLDKVTPPDTRPVIDRPDSMAPAIGALVLIEPGNPRSPWSGIPATGATVPNLAAPQAARALGVQASTLNGKIDYQGISGSASSKGIIERTSGGGLHAIMSQSVAPADGDGLRVRIPDGILEYLQTHLENDIYVSLWGRITRLTPRAPSWSAAAFNTVRSASSLLYSMGNDGTNFPVTSNRIGNRRDPGGAWTPTANPTFAGRSFFSSMAVARNTGTSDGTRIGKAFNIGAHGTQNEPFANGSAAADQASGVFYRYYMEDLTVSQRTYADVDWLDYVQYDNEVRKVGGRYYNDTYTAPSTY